MGRVGPEAAFLGPKIWKNEISLSLEESSDDEAPAGEFAIMNLEEFFNENNFELGRLSPPLPVNDDVLCPDIVVSGGEDSNSGKISSPRISSEDSSMDIGEVEEEEEESPSMAGFAWNKPKNELPKVLLLRLGGLVSLTRPCLFRFFDPWAFSGRQRLPVC